jgi:hypothetical protein
MIKRVWFFIKRRGSLKKEEDYECLSYAEAIIAISFRMMG